MLKKENYVIHLGYIIMMLTLGLILVMTDRWTGQRDFTVYLSNAATLISLVLALIAIFYSIVANSDLAQSFGSINKVAEDIAESKSEIKVFLEKTKEVADASNANAQSLRTISASVDANVASLQTALGELAEKTNTLYGTVSTLPATIGSLATRLDESMKQTAQPASVSSPRAEQAVPSDDVAKRLVNASSLYGQFLLYGCALAKKHDKPLSITQLAELVSPQPSNVEYFFGFYIALSSAGFVVGKRQGAVGETTRTYKITSLLDPIVTGIKGALLKAEQVKEDSAAGKQWQARIAALEAIFEKDSKGDQPA